jgi:hypothetical protein
MPDVDADELGDWFLVSDAEDPSGDLIGSRLEDRVPVHVCPDGGPGTDSAGVTIAGPLGRDEPSDVGVVGVILRKKEKDQSRPSESESRSRRTMQATRWSGSRPVPSRALRYGSSSGESV